MTLLILGPKKPRNDIDIYLTPLIENLMKLWVNRLELFNAYSKERFTLGVMLFYIINDFQAYASLSGYSNKGKRPICEVDIDDLSQIIDKRLCIWVTIGFFTVNTRFRRIMKPLTEKPRGALFARC